MRLGYRSPVQYEKKSVARTVAMEAGQGHGLFG
jgi:hypothetical protein